VTPQTVIAGSNCPTTSQVSGSQSPGGFEIDGNCQVNNGDRLDWQSSTVGSQPVGSDAVLNADTTNYSEGSHEIDDPDSWASGTGTAPDQSDIKDVYYYSDVDSGGNLWGYFAFSRMATSGSIGYWLELNQADNHTNSNGLSVPTRSPGDVRFWIYQDGSGGFGLSQSAAYKWSGSDASGSWSLIPPPTGAILAATSSDKSWMEIAINMSAIFGSAFSTCPPSAALGYLNLRSQSSSNGNPALKDFIDPIAIAPPSTCPRLTLVKDVAGGSASADSWTLTAHSDGAATGFRTVTGTSGVTGAVEDGKTYTLSESNGSSGYTPGTWSCMRNSDGHSVSVTGGSVTIPSGSSAPDGDITCTITNYLTNPPLPPQCGLNIALVLDLSLSISSSDFTTEKNAAKGLVNALQGTPSKVGLFTFATTAPARNNSNLDLVSVATSAGVNQLLDGIDDIDKPSSSSDGYTNWEAALTSVESSKKYDAILFVTDGNPTAWGSGGSSQRGTDSGSLATALTHGISASTVVKGYGTRIVAVGVNSGGTGGGAGVSGLNPDNLKAISGPTEYTGSNAAAADWFTVDDWSQLGSALNGIATATCQGTVTVIKKLQTWDGQDAGVGAGWTFTTTTDGVLTQVGNSASGQTGSDGTLTFTVDYASGESSKSVSLAETQQTGYDLLQQGGKNASCTSNGQPVAVTNDGGLGFGVDVEYNEVVSCTVINKEQKPASHLTLVKKVVNNHGGTADASDWTLSADGPTPISNVSTGTTTMVDDGSYTLSESNGPSGYTPSSWNCGSSTVTDGNKVTIGVGQDVTCTITNTDIAPKLTLVKKVLDLDGTDLTTPGLADDWTLTAGGDGGFAGAGNTSAVTGKQVKSNVAYALSESSVDGYNNGSAWSCVLNSGGGSLHFGGPSMITLTPGQDVTCTITNTKRFQPLTVSKTVDASYDTTYHWSIVKKVDKTTVTVDPGGSATFNYTVTVTPTGTTDSDWTMSGQITVDNDNSVDVTADVTDIPGVGGGAICTVTDGTGVTIPAHDSKTVDYSCTFTGKPNYSGTNAAKASWTWNGQQQSANSADVPAGFTLDQEINKTITVQDDKTTGTPITLGTWNASDGAHDFTYSVTKTATTGQCVSYDNTATIKETGQSANKSVEICAPEVTVAKSVQVNDVDGNGAKVKPGDVLTWTLTVHNAGSIAYTGPLFTDDVTQALAGTNLTDDLSAFTSSNSAVQLSYASKTLTGTANALPAGATVTVTYSGTVIGQDALNAGHITTIDNVVTPTGSTECDTNCTTTNPLTPKVEVAKSVTKDGDNWDGKQVKPGDVLTWTITVHNVSSVPFTDDALFTDNVSQALAGTDLAGDVSSFVSSDTDWMTVSFSTPTVTGTATAAGLPAGESVTLTYSGTVVGQDVLNADGITKIDNTVVPGDNADCAPKQGQDEQCQTHNPLTPKATVSKTVTVNDIAGDHTEVKPGDVLKWTITVRNTSSVPFTGELFTDDVSQALAGTDLVNTLSAFTSSDPSVTLSYTSPTLTGTANGLAAGAMVTVTYSGTVIGQDALNAGHVATIDNEVLPTAPVTCSVDCETENPLTPGASVAKSVTVNGVDGDGAQVKPGDVLVWTITVHNTSSVPFSGELFTDDVSQALAGTSLADDLTAFTSSNPSVVLSYSSPTLTGTANALPAGATVTVTYSGTVADQASLNDAGITTIDNVVKPTGPTTCDTDCDTHNPLTPKVEVSKAVTKGGVDWDGQQVKAGDVLTWTITVHNASSVPFTDDVLLTDNVEQALAGTSLADDVSAFTSSNTGWMTVSYASPVVTGTATAGGLPAGKSVTLTYSGTVINQAALNSKHITTIDNTVTPGTGVECAPTQGQDDQCRTTNPLTPMADVSKSVTVNGSDGDGAQVKPGDVLVWTITVRNTSSVPFTGELFTDDVSQALAGTDLADTATSFHSSDPSVQLTYAAKELTGTANGLAAGATVSVTYTGTVIDQAALNDGKITTIDNTVVPSAPTTCAGDCTTTNPLTPKADVSKSVTVNGSDGDGAQVKPGDVLVWTITVRNTSSVPYTGDLFTDDVSQALAGTNLANDATSFTSSAGAVVLSYSSPTLTGTADALPAGASVTVTYSGTVLDQDALNAKGITAINNTVLPTSPTTCAGDCTTENPLTPGASVAKSVTVNGVAGDGAQVKPGDVLVWTITVHNTSSVPFSGELFTDDVQQALAGTNLADVAASFHSSDGSVALSYSSPTLTGTATALPAGATVTVTYSGTVIDQDALNAGHITTIDNTVVPSSPTT
jgi:uncharacterized repeat protein (TIGR01451 family)